MSDLRQRTKQETAPPDAGTKGPAAGAAHPAGPIQNSALKQSFLIFTFVSFFLTSVTIMHTIQLIGVPLYWINRDYYYAYMAGTKRSFGLFANTITQFYTPTVVRISGDSSVRGQLKLNARGRLETKFPERLVLIANHQIYTDWLYLWWISYTGQMHGHIYIILKESLKYIPIIGPGMIFFGFIFMARSWVKDRPRLQHRLQALNGRHHGPLSGSGDLDPMWLLIFPEGTNLSSNGRSSSRKWAEKSGQADMQHQLLPRTTGLRFCLQELKDTVDWVYDCTIAYEGIPRGEFGQDIYTLPSMYFQGRIPKSVNMYWRCFSVKSIPIDDAEAFEKWLMQRWIEKDQLLEEHHQTGRFPKDESGGAGGNGYIETLVRSKSWLEVLSIYVPIIPIGLVVYGLVGLYRAVLGK